MQCVDFSISASQLGAVLGLFSAEAQYRAIIQIIRKSRFKKLLRSTPRTKHVQFFDLGDKWTYLEEQAQHCTTQEDIQELISDAKRILFSENAKLTEAATHLSAYISAQYEDLESPLAEKLAILDTGSPWACYEQLRQFQTEHTEALQCMQVYLSWLRKGLLPLYSNRVERLYDVRQTWREALYQH